MVLYTIDKQKAMIGYGKGHLLRGMLLKQKIWTWFADYQNIMK